MSPGMGEAYPEIEDLRRTAAAGGPWYEGSGTSVTVMVDLEIGVHGVRPRLQRWRRGVGDVLHGHQ